MPDHGVEALVHLVLLAPADLVHRRLHVVVNAALGDTTEGTEGVVVGVKEHLVGLRQIGAHEKSATEAQLEMGNLELGADTVDSDPVLAPVELESLAGGKLQRHVGLFAGKMPGFLLPLAPLAGKGRNPVIGAGITQFDQIPIQPLDRSALLAVPPGLAERPTGQGLAVIIELAGLLRAG